MGRFSPPPPFTVPDDVGPTSRIDERLLPLRGLPEGTLVGEIVPAGFEAYARVFHPGRMMPLARAVDPIAFPSAVEHRFDIRPSRGKDRWR